MGAGAGLHSPPGPRQAQTAPAEVHLEDCTPGRRGGRGRAATMQHSPRCLRSDTTQVGSTPRPSSSSLSLLISTSLSPIN